MNEKAKFLLAIVREVNSWDGSLENLNYFHNDDENLEMFFGNNIGEFARSLTFGKYHYLDNFFKFNGYGNIESMNITEVEEELIDWEEDIITLAEDIAERNGQMNYLLDEIEVYKENYKE